MAIESDAASIESILTALYESISHEAGGRPDWDRMRPLFTEGARIIPPALESAPLAVMDFETFAERVNKSRESSGDAAKGFHEIEVASRIETFGNIAHVWSTYESRYSPQDPVPFSRGINSFQLVNHDGRWWVVTIFWDMEREDNTIPSKYLPKEDAADGENND